MFHQFVGLNKIELYDLETGKSLNKYVQAVSLSNNHFKDENGNKIEPEKFNCYIVEKVSSKFPKIKKGNLIFLNQHTNKIDYAFDIPNIENYR